MPDLDSVAWIQAAADRAAELAFAADRLAGELRGIADSVDAGIYDDRASFAEALDEFVAEVRSA